MGGEGGQLIVLVDKTPLATARRPGPRGRALASAAPYRGPLTKPRGASEEVAGRLANKRHDRASGVVQRRAARRCPRDAARKRTRKRAWSRVVLEGMRGGLAGVDG